MCANMTLVLGGASSGKSNIAENMCINSTLNKVYLASAQVLDTEMRTKVDLHRTERGADWCTIEEPLSADRVISEAKADQILLFDCVTMWLTNHLLADHDLDAETENLIDALRRTPAQIVIVSNEVGMGIVPDNALSRRFRIAQGTLNRQLATQASCVIGVMAGLPFALKGVLPEGLL
nr:bifunctional adenosylcobinamide kinase/adenosylcobinamide-phosphate guanylyltransferase [Celeribacter neptunius]